MFTPQKLKDVNIYDPNANSQIMISMDQFQEPAIKTPTKMIPRMSSPSKKRSYADTKLSPDLFGKRMVSDSAYMFNQK